MTGIIYPTGHVWNIQDFGDPLCGLRTDISAQSDEASFTAALESGETIQVRSGNYVFRNWDATNGTACLVEAETSVKAHFSAGARLIAGDELNSEVGGMFKIIPATYPSDDDTLVLDLEGGVFDASALDPTDTGITLLDLYYFKRVRVANAVGYASGDTLGGGGDTFICTHECENVLIDACRAVGFYDCALYLSGGEAYEVRGGYYKYNGTIVAAKRDARNLIIHGVYGIENSNGFVGSPANVAQDDQGRQWIIANNFLFKCQGRPIVVHMGQGDIIQGNHIEDFGKTLADPSVYTSVSVGHEIGGIELVGSVGATVSGNWIGYRNWDTTSSAPTSGHEPHGILVGPYTFDTPNVQSTDNMIEHNTLVGTWRAIQEKSSSNANYFSNNIEKGTTSASVTVGSTSWLAVDTPRQMTFTPVLTAASGSVTPDAVQGVYQVSNKRVDFNIYIDLPSSGSTLSGALKITGLPYASDSSAQNTCRMDINNGPSTHSSSSYTYWLGVIVSNSSEILLMEGGTGSDGMIPLTAARLSGDCRINVSGSYWRA